jgi:Putative MetA-pathway of phenol degradation
MNSRVRRMLAAGLLSLLGASIATSHARAQGSVVDAVQNYFETWFDRVDQAQSSQPHWITPLITVTPRLEEEIRLDYLHESLPNGASVNNYINNKGLELIPTTTNEIILGIPSYEVRDQKEPASGWGDYPFLLVKQRLLSANEQSGNYILTFFLQGVAPTGSKAFTNNSYLVNPTIAFGKGWGNFDIQATVGASIPTTNTHVLGDSILTNVAFQYNINNILWPEFEVSYTYWPNGERAGKNQVLLTPGIIVGRIPIYKRARLIFGVGYQVAVSPKEHPTSPLLPTYRNAPVVTVRVAF